MKVSRATRYRNRPSPPFRWIPQGFYNNRPSLLLKMLEGGIGRHESMRLVISNLIDNAAMTNAPRLTIT